MTTEGASACWAGKDSIEMLLALGASRWEALHGTLQTGALAAVMPVLDQMSVMGLVAMPGFMAGQLLSGVSAPQVNLSSVPNAGLVLYVLMHFFPIIG